MDDSSGDFSLVELLRPLYLQRKVLVWGSAVILGVCLLAGLWVAFGRDRDRSTFVEVRVAQPLFYKDLQEIQRSFFKPETKTSITYMEGETDPHFPKGKDAFIGYFDAQGVWTQTGITQLYVRGEATPSQVQQRMIQFQEEHILSWVTQNQLRRFKQPHDVVSLLRAVQKTEERLLMLKGFQASYPSLIRSNLVLNNAVVPVESQIMAAELQLQGFRAVLADQTLDQLRGTFYEQLAKLKAGEPLPSLEVPAEFLPQLNLEKANLEWVLADAKATIRVLTQALVRQMPAPPLGKDLVPVALAFLALEVLLVLSLYAVHFARRLKGS